MKLHWKAVLIFALVPALVAAVAAQTAQASAAALALENARKKEVVDGDLEGAVKLYKEILSKYPGVRSIAAEALIGLGRSFEKTGNAEARPIYERVLAEYLEQKTAAA